MVTQQQLIGHLAAQTSGHKGDSEATEAFLTEQLQ
jgi:hypothetical protein